jgi:hypothetical protein
MGTIVNESINGDGEHRLQPLKETSPDEVCKVVIGGRCRTHFGRFSDVAVICAVVRVVEDGMTAATTGALPLGTRRAASTSAWDSSL